MCSFLKCRYGRNADEMKFVCSAPGGVQTVRPSFSPHNKGGDGKSAAGVRQLRVLFHAELVLQPKSGTVVGVLPASGYRNESNLNNHGSNGNYWSSTLNSNNTSNAYNLNFNSGNFNSNNNRYNGHTVRPVAAPAFLWERGNNDGTSGCTVKG